MKKYEDGYVKAKSNILSSCFFLCFNITPTTGREGKIGWRIKYRVENYAI